MGGSKVHSHPFSDNLVNEIKVDGKSVFYKYYFNMNIK